jgi:hypothetical protein
VNIDNQTHLTLEVELVDQHRRRLTLGAHQPGLTSRSEVADLGPSWTVMERAGYKSAATILAAFFNTPAAAAGDQDDRAALPGHPRLTPPGSTGHRRVGARYAAATVGATALHGGGTPAGARLAARPFPPRSLRRRTAACTQTARPGRTDR